MRTAYVLAAIAVIVVMAGSLTAKSLTETEELRLTSFLNRSVAYLDAERVAVLRKSQILFVSDDQIKDFAKRNKLSQGDRDDLLRSVLFVPKGQPIGIFLRVDSDFIQKLLAAGEDTVRVYALAAMVDHEIDHLLGEIGEAKPYAREFATLERLIKQYRLEGKGLEEYLAQKKKLVAGL